MHRWRSRKADSRSNAVRTQKRRQAHLFEIDTAHATTLQFRSVKVTDVSASRGSDPPRACSRRRSDPPRRASPRAAHATTTSVDASKIGAPLAPPTSIDAHVFGAPHAKPGPPGEVDGRVALRRSDPHDTHAPVLAPAHATTTSIDAPVLGAPVAAAVASRVRNDVPLPGAGGAAGLTTAARSERMRRDARRTSDGTRRRHSSAADARRAQMHTRAASRGARASARARPDDTHAEVCMNASSTRPTAGER